MNTAVARFYFERNANFGFDVYDREHAPSTERVGWTDSLKNIELIVKALNDDLFGLRNLL